MSSDISAGDKEPSHRLNYKVAFIKTETNIYEIIQLLRKQSLGKTGSGQKGRSFYPKVFTKVIKNSKLKAWVEENRCLLK